MLTPTRRSCTPVKVSGFDDVHPRLFTLPKSSDSSYWNIKAAKLMRTGRLPFGYIDFTLREGQQSACHPFGVLRSESRGLSPHRAWDSSRRVSGMPFSPTTLSNSNSGPHLGGERTAKKPECQRHGTIRLLPLRLALPLHQHQLTLVRPTRIAIKDSAELLVVVVIHPFRLPMRHVAVVELAQAHQLFSMI